MHPPFRMKHSPLFMGSLMDTFSRHGRAQSWLCSFGLTKTSNKFSREFSKRYAFPVNLVSTFDNLKTGCKPDKHWVLTTCQPFYEKITVDYKIVWEKKPAWKVFGQCKAVAVQFNNTEERMIRMISPLFDLIKV